MVLGLGHHDAVDQDPRHRDLLGRQGAGGRQPLDLGDDEPLAGLGRHGDREIVEQERLALHADIAVGVGRGAADDRDVDREGLVEQPLPPADLHHPDEVLGCCSALSLPPPWRGSTKVPRPTRLSRPGRRPAISRNSCETQPRGRFQASIRSLGRHPPELGHQ